MIVVRHVSVESAVDDRLLSTVMSVSPSVTDSLSDWLTHPSPSSHHHTYAVSRGADMTYTGNVRRLSSDSDYADIPLSPAGMHTAEEELGQSLEDLLGTEGHLTADDDDDDEEHTDDYCVTYYSAQPATLCATQASRGECQSDSLTQEDIRPITPVSSTSTVSADQLRANSESPSQLYESVLVSEKNHSGDDTVRGASTESESVRCTAETSVSISSADNNDSCSSAAGSKFLFYIE